MALIGTNLQYVRDWTMNFPFLDRMKTARDWIFSDGSGNSISGTATFDADGWVTGLPAGASRFGTYVQVEPASLDVSHRYVITYEGTGGIDFSDVKIISSEAGRIVVEYTGSAASMRLTVMNPDPNDMVRDIHVVREDQVTNFENGEVFNPDFVDHVSDWGMIRTMDWTNTNDSPLAHWEDRTTVSDLSWAGSFTNNQVPIEILVQLANEAHTDLWINIPHLADDNYILQTAIYVRDHLDQGLTVHFEYSNEVWNWQFAQSSYAQQMGSNLWGHDVNGDGVVNISDPNEVYPTAWVEYYGYRSAQMAAITNSVFTGADQDRLANVISTQTAYLGLADYVLAGAEKANLGSLSSLFDSYAITGYFWGDMIDPNSQSGLAGGLTATLLNWARSGEAGMALAFRQLEYGDVLPSGSGSLADLATVYAYHAAIAERYGLDLDVYEGGHHLTVNGFPADAQTEIMAFFTRLSQDPRMGELYLKNYELFKAVGGDMFNVFNDIGGPGQMNYFGLIDSLYDTDGSARYDAYIGVNQASKAPQPVIANGTDGDDVIQGGSLADTLHGGLGHDTLSGLAGDDQLDGGDGNDTLDGGEGSDTMVGGTGDDTYIVDNVADTVIELADEGNDTVIASVDWTLGANVENLRLTGTATRGTGNELANSLYGNPDLPSTLAGGKGDDSYYVHAGDTVVENAGEGTDTVYAYADWVLGANVENLRLTGTATRGTGNELANSLYGNPDLPSTLAGGKGNDSYYVHAGDTVVENAGEGTDTVYAYADWTLGANVENLRLTGTATRGTGNELANSLYGNPDLPSTLAGGKGNDSYYVHAGDTVVENAGEGTDTVYAYADWVLGANVENLTLLDDARRGTGNALNNVLTGNAGDNILDGGAGSDTLDGGLGVDTLIGGAGDDYYVVTGGVDIILEAKDGGNDTVFASYDFVLPAFVETLVLNGDAIRGTGNNLDNVLIGNAHANILAGGAGNDSYIVDAGDVVIEKPGEGIDTVFSTVDFTLGANVENLTLTGLATRGTGNELDNILRSGALPAVLTGGNGNDSYYVKLGDTIVEHHGEGIDTVYAYTDWSLGNDIENLELLGSATRGFGNSLDNILHSNSLFGSTLWGGGGNDSYYVKAGDTVIEGSDPGIDTVYASSNWTLGDNIENLVLQGSATQGTGNALDNNITGNALNNLFDGGAGNDTLTGGGGNDIFVLADNHGRDIVTDFAVDGAGRDQVRISGFNGSAADFLAHNVFQTTDGAELRLTDGSTMLLAHVSTTALTADNLVIA